MTVKNLSANTPGENPSLFFYFRLLLGLVLVFTAFCFYQPEATLHYSAFTRTWGFDHILLYGQLMQLLFYAIALILILPYTNTLLLNLVQGAAKAIASMRKLKILLFITVSLLSVLLFYLLRVKYFFLGDFNLRLEQIMRKEVLATEYLTMKFLYYFAAFFKRYDYTPYQSFPIYSCLAGGVFVFFSCLIADLLGKDPFQKLIYFLVHVGSGLLLVFCGYIEIYATVIVLMNIFLYFGLRYLKTGKGFYMVLLSFVLAVASHLLSIAIAPAVFVLYYFKNESQFGMIAAMSRKKIISILLILVVIMVIFLLKSKNSFVLPLSPPPTIRNYLTLFSFRHLWEWINGQVLACGVSFAFMPFLVYKINKDKLRLDPQTYFFASITACFLLIIFLVNLHRGSGDWDIMASTAITFNTLTALLIFAIYNKAPLTRNYLLLVLAGLNLLHAFLWININHTDRSKEKIDRMLSGDPGTYYNRLPSLLQLGLIYEENKLMQDAERIGERACSDPRNTDARPCLFYAKKLIINKKDFKAVPVLEDLIVKMPFKAEPYFFLSEYYYKHKQLDKFVRNTENLFNAFTRQPQVFLSDKTYGKPDMYLSLFGYLYQQETHSPNPNPQRIKQLESVIVQLQQGVPQKK